MAPLSPMQGLHQISRFQQIEKDDFFFPPRGVDIFHIRGDSCVGRHTPLPHWSRPCHRFLFILPYNTIVL